MHHALTSRSYCFRGRRLTLPSHSESGEHNHSHWVSGSRSHSADRPLAHSRPIHGSTSVGVHGKSRRSTASQRSSGGWYSRHNPSAKSYPCTKISSQPMPANADRSATPNECQARSEGAAAVTTVASTAAADSIESNNTGNCACRSISDTSTGVVAPRAKSAAYQFRQSTMCAAVARHDHVRVPAGLFHASSRLTVGVNDSTTNCAARRTCWPVGCSTGMVSVSPTTLHNSILLKSNRSTRLLQRGDMWRAGAE